LTAEYWRAGDSLASNNVFGKIDYHPTTELNQWPSISLASNYRTGQTSAHLVLTIERQPAQNDRAVWTYVPSQLVNDVRSAQPVQPGGWNAECAGGNFFDGNVRGPARIHNLILRRSSVAAIDLPV